MSNRRHLTPEEADALGLPRPKPSRHGALDPEALRVRPLTPEEADALGLPTERPSVPGTIDLNNRSPVVTPDRARLLGFTQSSTMGYGEEIGAGIGRAMLNKEPPRLRLGKAFAPDPNDTPEQRRIKEVALQREAEALQSGPETYRGLRDAQRDEIAHAQKEQPVPYSQGQAAGTAASMALPGAAPASIPGAIASGASYGVINALGNSDVDLTKPATAEGAKKLGRELLIGGVGGGLAGGAGAAAPMLIRGAGQKLAAGGVGLGRKVLLGGTRTLGPNLKQLSDEAVREAYKAGGILPFGTTKGAAVRMEKAAEEVGAKYGAILDALEKAGVRGPRAEKLAREMEARAREEFLTSGSNKAVANLYDAEAQNVRNISAPRPDMPADEVAIGPMGEAVAVQPRELKLLQAEKVKRRQQNEANYGRYEDTPQNEAKKEIAAMYRQAIEDSVDEAGRAAPANSDVALAAESFVPIKQKFGRTAEARDAAVQGARAAANRGALGLSEKNAIAGAAATMNPVALAQALGGATLLKGAAARAGSTAGAGLFWLGEALRPVANMSQRVNPRLRSGLAAAIERALTAETPISDEEKRKQALAEAILGSAP